MNPTAIAFWGACALFGYYFNGTDGAVLGGALSMGFSVAIACTVRK